MMQQMNLPNVWHWWFTPRSTNRSEIFVERSIRVLLPILLMVIFGSYFRIFNTPTPSRWMIINPMIDMLFFMTLFGVGIYAICKNRVNAAGIILSCVLLAAFVVSIKGSGYWNSSIFPIAITLILTAALVLTTRQLIAFALVVTFSLPLTALWQESTGMTAPLLNGVPLSTPGSILTASLFTIPLILALFFVLKQEYRRRATEAAELAATFEQRVIERTRELDEARHEAERLYKEQMAMVEKLRAVDHLKSQFLASMSHELRTPLNAILNFTEFVRMGMLGSVNEQQEDALGKTMDSARHLLALINDVLDMTKIESGMMKLFIEPDVNIQEELKSVSATARTLLKDKPVQFVEDFDSDLPLVRGDRRRIRQVLLNLISNATKFTEIGTVTFSAKIQGDELLFAVIDTGPGIAFQDHKLIFEPFRQTEHGVQHAGGTGLGLPIARRLIEAHGGCLWLESSPGEGAAFYVTLPVDARVADDMLVQP